MTFDETRGYRHHVSYSDPGLYHNYYSQRGLHDRLTNSSVLLAVLVLVPTVLYFLKGELFYRMLSSGRRSLSGLSGMALGAKPVGERPEPPGLGNMNNSCYQNSILQGLASLESLPSYLSTIPPDVDEGRPGVRTVDALRDFLDELNNPDNNGRTLWTPWILKSMDSWQQQDAQEYYSKILDAVDKDMSIAAKHIRRRPSCDRDVRGDDAAISLHSDDSGYQSMLTSKPCLDALLTRNPLEGLIAQRVACVSCGACEGLSTIPFNCLTLNLGLGSRQHDLDERLDNYTKVEEINGVECPKCSLLKAQSTIKQILEIKPDGYPEFRERLAIIEEALEDDAFDEATLVRCKISPQKRVTSTKTKQAVIARPPRSLAIHMNRSVFDERTGHMYKNFAPVQFPKQLDLGPWCLGSAGSHDKLAADGEDSPIHLEEQWLVHPRQSMVAGSLRPSRIRGPIYELRAVVTHFGAHESGHYICYRRTIQSPRPDKDSEEQAPPQLASEGDEGYAHEAASAEGTSEEKVTEAAPGLDETSESMDTEEPVVTEEPKPQWWRISDEDVCPADETTVLNQASGVFMLFYDCIDPNSALASEADGDSEVSSADTIDESIATPDDSDVDAGEPQRVALTGSIEEAMLGGLEGSMLKLAVWDDAISAAAAKVPLPDDEAW
ncbi:ubiquitin carboxyl-terminal hydrolase 1 [Podospora conica]|nr:ubiquitin carboxyl-terminal hydrolase 1 [Schizothecium conicum]